MGMLVFYHEVLLAAYPSMMIGALLVVMIQYEILNGYDENIKNVSMRLLEQLENITPNQ